MPLGLSRIWIKTGALLRAVLFLQQNTRNAKSSRSVTGDLTANKAAADDHGYGLGHQSSIWTQNRMRRKAELLVAQMNVCFWHKADIPTRSTNVGFALADEFVSA
jgi:hypothetical protein